MPNYFGWKETFAVAWASQTAYDAANGSPSWQWMEASSFDTSYSREIETIGLSVSKDFEVQPRVVGGAHGGSITFRAPIASQVSGYDPTSDTPSLGAAAALLEDFFGSKTVGANDKDLAGSGSDSNTLELASGALDVGSFYATGGATPFTVNARGFAKSDDGSQTVTLFEDSPVVPTASDNVYPSVTLYGGASVAALPYRTFRMTGSAADHDVIFIGCTATKCVISLESGKQPTAEFTYTFTNYQYDANAGGLTGTAATAHQRIAPIIGANGGRVWLSGTSTGSAELTGTCGVNALTLTIDVLTTPIPCHAGSQGYSANIVRRRQATASFNIPWTADWITGTDPNDNKFDESLIEGTTMSLSVMSGSKAGQLFALLIPAGVVTAQSTLVDVGGVAAFSVELSPAAYTGDTGTGDAADSVIRMALG